MLKLFLHKNHPATNPYGTYRDLSAWVGMNLQSSCIPWRIGVVGDSLIVEKLEAEHPSLYALNGNEAPAQRQRLWRDWQKQGKSPLLIRQKDVPLLYQQAPEAFQHAWSWGCHAPEVPFHLMFPAEDAEASLPFPLQCRALPWQWRSLTGRLVEALEGLPPTHRVLWVTEGVPPSAWAALPQRFSAQRLLQQNATLNALSQVEEDLAHGRLRWLACDARVAHALTWPCQDTAGNVLSYHGVYESRGRPYFQASFLHASPWESMTLHPHEWWKGFFKSGFHKKLPTHHMEALN
jgi:hypothetical protein